MGLSRSPREIARIPAVVLVEEVSEVVAGAFSSAAFGGVVALDLAGFSGAVFVAFADLVFDVFSDGELLFLLLAAMAEPVPAAIITTTSAKRMKEAVATEAVTI
jgi:hypothetical protein